VDHRNSESHHDTKHRRKKSLKFLTFSLNEQESIERRDQYRESRCKWFEFGKVCLLVLEDPLNEMILFFGFAFFFLDRGFWFCSFL